MNRSRYAYIIIGLVVILTGLSTLLIDFSRADLDTREVEACYVDYVSGAGWRSVPDDDWMNAEVRNILGFDYANVQEGDIGGVPVLLYMAVWSSGSRSYFSIERHVPEICWTRSGWIVEESAMVDFSDGSVRFLVFIKEGARQYVYYRHVDLHTELHVTKNGNGLFSRVRNVLLGGFTLPSQYFVRISSPEELKIELVIEFFQSFERSIFNE